MGFRERLLVIGTALAGVTAIGESKYDQKACWTEFGSLGLAVLHLANGAAVFISIAPPDPHRTHQILNHRR